MCFCEIQNSILHGGKKKKNFVVYTNFYGKDNHVIAPIYNSLCFGEQ
jgi:hypothetical protein